MKNKLPILLFLSFIIIISCEHTGSDNHFDWKNISNNITNHGLVSIHMVDENVGFVGGFSYIEIKKTINQVKQNNFSDSVLVSPNEYYNIEYQFEDSSDFPPALYKTVNGGKSWQPVSAPFKIRVQDIFFVNENVGYVSTSGEGVFKTTDGGDNWTKILGNLVHYYHGATYFDPFSSLIFFNESTGIVYDQFGTTGMVLKTTNGGETWNIISMKYPENVSGKYLTIFNDLDQMIFPNLSDTGYTINGNHLYRTTDKGDTWNEIYTSSSNRRLNVGFISSQTGFMPDKHLVTMDAGNTWSYSLDIPLSSNNIIPVNNREFYYIQNGQIFKMTTWEESNSVLMTKEVNTIIEELFFPSENVGYALSSAAILKYTKKSQ